MKVVITGGLGFLGVSVARELVRRGALAGPAGPEAVDAITLFDTEVPDALPAGLDGSDTRVEMAAGDIADRDRVFSVVDRDDVCVFHLASVVSAGAERDFDLALRVNVEGGLNVLEALRQRGGRPRVVFASSLAVYGGAQMPAAVTDWTRETPATTYGMTKAIGELLVNEYTRKGYLCGRTARLATVVVRPGQPNAAASGFASAVFREPLAGEAVTLPVGPEARMMVIGARVCVAGLIGLMEAEASALGDDRAVSLPNADYSVSDMIAALERVAASRGIRPGPVRFAPDPAVEAIVGTWPLKMDDARARALGLPADEGLDRIVEDYLDDPMAGRGAG